VLPLVVGPVNVALVVVFVAFVTVAIIIIFVALLTLLILVVGWNRIGKFASSFVQELDNERN